MRDLSVCKRKPNRGPARQQGRLGEEGQGSRRMTSFSAKGIKNVEAKRTLLRRGRRTFFRRGICWRKRYHIAAVTTQLKKQQGSWLHLGKLVLVLPDRSVPAKLANDYQSTNLLQYSLGTPDLSYVVWSKSWLLLWVWTEAANKKPFSCFSFIDKSGFR